MKRFFTLLCALVFSINLSAQTPLTEAVDFSTVDHYGNEINLFEILDGGQHVLIHFFYTPITHCKNAAPKVVDAYYALGSNQHDVFFMEISPTDHNKAPYYFIDNWIANYGIEFPTIHQESGGEHSGEDICNMYQINAYPTMVLISPDRKIVVQDIWPIESTQTIIDALTPFGIEEHGANHVVSYGNYSLKYTVTSTDPAECKVVCSEQPSLPTEIEIPSKVVITSGDNQTEIVIGETSSSSQYIPTHEYYNYSVTQQIYTAEEIQVNAGAITSIAFRQTESVSDTRNLEVYMLNTTKDYFEGSYDWFNVTSENLVFSGNVTYPAVAGEWLELEFDKQFLYEGGNVVVCVVDKTGSWTNGKSFDTFETGSNRTLFTYRDNSAYDLTNMSSINAAMTSEINVVKFNYVEGDVYDVTSIGDEAFRACENLTGVIIPSTVNNISGYAFADCSSLSFISCSAENVPETAENAFDGVPSDMKVSVPTQSIDAYKATLPWSNFMVVGPYELQFTITSTEPAECEVRCLLKPISETTLTIPSTVTIDDVVYSVTSIADSAFLGCDKFIGDLVIPNTVRSVGVRAFRDCVGFDGTLTLSENLEVINDLAFAGGADVNVNYTGKLTIPNSVEYIGIAAFQNCSSLTSLEFEEDSQITSLEQNVFRNCSSLTGSLQIPNTVTTIGNYAFAQCYNLTGDLIIPNTVTSVGVEAFWECRGFDGTLTLSENLEVINDKAFASYEGQMGFWGTLVIPSGVRTIGQAAFQNCSNLSLLEIEEGSQLETIDHWAFTQCYSLGGDLLIPNTVTYIGDYAFYSTSINSLNFEENSQLNSIGNYAFHY
ncbi:MAG: leucine-rich repeat protein, partial [Bacteroidales bacterium]|nr:leucine-rich repeat protein [Bacteroidales bacterium]